MAAQHTSGRGGARPDAVVVGAGLAGLACALDLTAAGLSVTVLEASDAVGGRMRTDRRDGFLLDRGFQVFNTSYPQVRRRLDLRSLRLRPFTPGMLLHTPDGRLRFADPTRRPRQAGDLLRGRLAGPRDLAALAALGARDAFAPAAAVRGRPGGREPDARRALRAAGFSPAFVERMWRPFLSGVFLEDELATSARFLHLVWRSMLRGTLCLPAGGIGAVPRALAARLPPGTVRLETPVREVTGEGVVTADGEEVPARAVVVATDGRTAAALLPGVDAPAGRAVTTFYHAAPLSPLPEPTLLVDTERHVLNTVVLSEVAPGRSPDTRALVSTSVLGAAGEADEPRVRARLGELYGTGSATDRWEHLATYAIPDALPAMEPPLVLSRTTRVAPGRYVCGDHRATGSVQGALASGARAAREAAAFLRA
ncbi:NAD(P)/FAD-dependent oxidoreductase [Streptomyces sp. DH37]|uniref:NAD(P)/FAD-dependent oxidoreductase n=1 Tax=Streptomyces sp. DH37 TaxID=3040122 RepID=UPI00244235E2|nr:NAD(P)/FAD-dependent oxidoreductase [Streptomyces sp. DH37]MDG9701407.1 NAD(P)/FAD-dependent oxidoreductase [Streptomyces sp. DH37]